MAPQADILRATLHPDGLARHIANVSEWSSHLLRRLEREISVTGDPKLAALYDEFLSYPGVYRDDSPLRSDPSRDIVVALRILDDGGELSFFSTVTSFGSPLDATMADLAIDCFYPAYRETANRLARSNRPRSRAL